MKLIVFYFFIFCTILGCSTNIKINKTRIHRNEKFKNSFAIHKITLDSFNLTGEPIKYKIDSAYHCNIALEFENIEFGKFIKRKSKNEFMRLNKLLDSLKSFDEMKYRVEDTLNIFGIRYIPSGIKKSINYYETEEKINFLKNTKSKFRYKRNIWLGKSNKYYNWSSSSEKDKIRQRIPYLSFQQNVWYSISFDNNYGFLTSGIKTIYFYFDNKNMLQKFEKDKINDAAF